MADGTPITRLSPARQQIENARVQRQGLIARIKAKQQNYRLARRLFAHDDGTLTRDGHAFFALVADMAGMGRLTPRESDREEIWAAAQRALALKIMNLIHVDEVQMLRLSQIAEGAEDD